MWKLDGLSEYDIRRPLTATGTNLLGLFEPCGYMREQLDDYSIGAPDAKGCWALELGGYRPCDARRRPSPESVKPAAVRSHPTQNFSTQPVYDVNCPDD